MIGMMFMLICYLVLIIIRPHEYGVEVSESPIPRLFLLGGFLFWLGAAEKNLRVPQATLVPALSVWAMLSLMSMLYLDGTIEAFLEFVPLMLFFYPLSAAATSRRSLHVILATILISAGVLALHSIEQAQSGIGWSGQPLVNGRVQYIGILSDPNDLGMLFVFSVPIATTYVFHASNFLFRIGSVGILGLLLYGIILTDSRGSLLAVLAITGLYMIRRYGRVATISIGVMGLPVLFAATRLSTIDTEEESAAGRLDAWYAGLQMFESDPIFGAGFGLFTDHHYLTAHNSWVLAIGELGLPGYIVWFTLVVVSLYMVYWLVDRDRRFERPSTVVTETPATDIGKADRQMASLLMYASLGAMATCFFLSRTYMILLFVMWALAAGHYRGTVNRHPGLPELEFARLWRTAAWLGLFSIFGFYILVRVALVVL